MIEKEVLQKLYLVDRVSMKDISLQLGHSEHKVVLDGQTPDKTPHHQRGYLPKKPIRTVTLCVKPIKTKADAELLGMGLGLYWGEGTKASKHSVRLGNTDPELIKMFMRFLMELFGVQKERFKFGLQIFTDIDVDEALAFWVQQLGVDRSQFCKITVTISGSIGTYRNKSKYGVVTLHFNNMKLRDIIVGMLPR
jgi:hypothetical protein